MTLTMASSRIARPALRGWPLFIALSLLFHLLLFLLVTLFASDHLQPGVSPGVPLAVQIVTVSSPQKAAHQASSENNTPSPAANQPVQESIAQAAAIEPVETITQPAVVMADRVVTPVQGDSQAEDEMRLHIESLIRTRFSEHFVYPLMAQRHGWQGEVVLSFRISSDGTITTVEVVRSSGHAVLDQAALDSMRAIERIEFTPGTTLHHTLELRMPVIYQIAQG